MSSLPSKKIRGLQKKARELSLDIQAIVKEHDSYMIKGDAKTWLERLSVETLNDSLSIEHGVRRDSLPLAAMKHKFGLRKLHDKVQQELDRVQSELRVEKIDTVLKRIAQVV
jgi:hypothetical protein